MIIKEACALRATANVVITAPEIDAISGSRITPGVRVLLAGQTTASQNGIYVPGVTGSELCPGGVFGVGGTITFAVAQGVAHYWAKAAGTDSLTYSGGTLTSSGWFVTDGDGGNITLAGTEDDDVEDSIKAAVFNRSSDADAGEDWSQSFQVTAAGVPYAWSKPETFVLGTTVVTLATLTTTPGTPWDEDANAPTTAPAVAWAPDLVPAATSRGPNGSLTPLQNAAGAVLFDDRATPILAAP